MLNRDHYGHWPFSVMIGQEKMSALRNCYCCHNARMKDISGYDDKNHTVFFQVINFSHNLTQINHLKSFVSLKLIQMMSGYYLLICLKLGKLDMLLLFQMSSTPTSE